ncbi:uncharacterized protein L201_006021 [Kwoniella dendrophila CBS 6074]|uniref:DUF1746 domain-containing protein n=1 Tax=Kwoniella dendrophila CBS 6074 TaxID=1295534 RepID=A0AAX4K2N1_9TREE
MVYAPQRRHAVASLATTAQALCVMQYFYSPNLLILIARVLAQVQINACAFIHPSKSLLGLTLMLVALNIAAAFLHLLDFVGEMNAGKGLILDFVGQANPASLTRILLLDLLLFVMQLTGLCVSYVNHSTNLPKSSSFPYDDLLLPPTTIQEESISVSTTLFDEDEDDLYIEGGVTKSKRSIRKRNGSRYQAVQGDEEEEEEEERELWLNEDEGPSKKSNPTIRITEPPIIFNLPLRHILLLIFKLPSPTPPPRAFSGGTPISTPPFTPQTAPSARIPDEGDHQESTQNTSRTGLGLRGVEDVQNNADIGRIPGEYRREGEGNGNGG